MTDIPEFYLTKMDLQDSTCGIKASVNDCLVSFLYTSKSTDILMFSNGLAYALIKFKTFK